MKFVKDNLAICIKQLICKSYQMKFEFLFEKLIRHSYIKLSKIGNKWFKYLFEHSQNLDLLMLNFHLLIKKKNTQTFLNAIFKGYSKGNLMI